MRSYCCGCPRRIAPPLLVFPPQPDRNCRWGFLQTCEAFLPRHAEIPKSFCEKSQPWATVHPHSCACPKRTWSRHRGPTLKGDRRVSRRASSKTEICNCTRIFANKKCRTCTTVSVEVVFVCSWESETCVILCIPSLADKIAAVPDTNKMSDALKTCFAQKTRAMTRTNHPDFRLPVAQ